MEKHGAEVIFIKKEIGKAVSVNQAGILEIERRMRGGESRHRINDAINRHTSLFDVKKIGIHHRVVILFKSRDKTKKEFEQWLMENQRINSLMKVNGDWSFVAEAFFPDIKAMEKFTKKSREEFEIDKISILYILEDLKREAFLLESTAQ